MNQNSFLAQQVRDPLLAIAFNFHVLFNQLTVGDWCFSLKLGSLETKWVKMVNGDYMTQSIKRAKAGSFKAVLLMGAAALSGCATTSETADNSNVSSSNPTVAENLKATRVEFKVSGSGLVKSFAAPLYDLNIMREAVPVSLPGSSDLYALPEVVTCMGIQAEIDDLTAVLGADPAFAGQGAAAGKAGYKVSLDINSQIENEMTDLIPYASYIRKLSGARRHEKKIEQAKFRGHLQRAHLHGKAAELNCPIKQAPSMRRPVIKVAMDDARDLKTTSVAVPEYPKACASRHNRAETIKVRYDIDMRGRTKNVAVFESSENCFDRSAVKAAKAWRFEPVVLDGKARYVSANVTTISFETGNETPIFANYVKETVAPIPFREHTPTVMMAAVTPVETSSSFHTASYEAETFETSGSSFDTYQSSGFIEPEYRQSDFAHDTFEDANFVSAAYTDSFSSSADVWADGEGDGAFVEGRDYKINDAGEVIILTKLTPDPEPVMEDSPVEVTPSLKPAIDTETKPVETLASDTQPAIDQPESADDETTAAPVGEVLSSVEPETVSSVNIASASFTATPFVDREVIKAIRERS